MIFFFIKIKRQAIHTVHHHGVACPGETHEGFQFRPLDILARCFVGKSAVNLDAIQLPFRILVKSADPNVSNALSDHGIPNRMSGKTL